MSTPTQVTEIATNLDDATGEVVGAAIETLLADGALDAWVVPATFKKGRPGFVVHVLARPRDAKRLADRLLAETGAFGCRLRPWDRVVLNRTFTTTPTPHGPVTTKIGRLGHQTIAVKAEFDDARRLADKTGVPVRRILTTVKAKASGRR